MQIILSEYTGIRELPRFTYFLTGGHFFNELKWFTEIDALCCLFEYQESVSLFGSLWDLA